MTIRRVAAALVLGGVMMFAASTRAQEPGWSTAVSPLSAESQQIRQQHILNRPYRLGHVYGNTVRRMHYRGHPFPMPAYRSQRGFRW